MQIIAKYSHNQNVSLLSPLMTQLNTVKLVKTSKKWQGQNLHRKIQIFWQWTCIYPVQNIPNRQKSSTNVGQNGTAVGGVCRTAPASPGLLNIVSQTLPLYKVVLLKFLLALCIFNLFSELIYFPQKSQLKVSHVLFSMNIFSGDASLSIWLVCTIPKWIFSHILDFDL